LTDSRVPVCSRASGNGIFGFKPQRINARFLLSQGCWEWQIPFPFPRSRREWREWGWEHIDLTGYCRSRSRVPKRPGTAITMRKYGRFPIPGVYPYGRPFFGNGSRGWLVKAAKPTWEWEIESPLLMREIHAARSNRCQGDMAPGSAAIPATSVVRSSAPALAPPPPVDPLARRVDNPHPYALPARGPRCV